MVTQYPAKIDDIITLPVLVDNVHAINAAVINRLREAIIAIEEELGESPASIYTNVRERLDNLDAIFGSLQTISLAGDLGNNHTTPRVIGIRGVPVSSATPLVNQVLTFNGTSWSPTNLTGGVSTTFTAAGDLSGTDINQTVIGLQTRPVSSSAPNAGDVLTWNGSEWAPEVNASGGSGIEIVPDLIARDAIPSNEREEGMLVYVLDNGTGPAYYQLGAGLTNADWSLADFVNSLNIEPASVTTGPIVGTSLTTSLITISGKIIANGIDSSSLSDSNQGVIYYDLSENKFKVSENGGAYVDLLGGGGGGGTPGGSNTQVQFNDSGTFGADAGLTYNKTTNVLSISDALALGALPASAGNIRLPHQGSIKSRDSTDTVDVTLLSTDSGDNVILGSTSIVPATYIRASAGVTTQSASYRIQNAAGTVDRAIIDGGASDFLALGAAPASTGSIRLSAGGTIYGVSNGGFDTRLLRFNESNDFVLRIGESSTVGTLILETTNAPGAATSIQVSGSERFRVETNGVQFGQGGLDLGSGVQVIGIDNATTNPTTNPTAGIVVYVDAGDGYLKYRKADGSIITLNGAGGGGGGSGDIPVVIDSDMNITSVGLGTDPVIGGSTTEKNVGIGDTITFEDTVSLSAVIGGYNNKIGVWPINTVYNGDQSFIGGGMDNTIYGYNSALIASEQGTISGLALWSMGQGFKPKVEYANSNVIATAAPVGYGITRSQRTSWLMYGRITSAQSQGWPVDANGNQFNFYTAGIEDTFMSVKMELIAVLYPTTSANTGHWRKVTWDLLIHVDDTGNGLTNPAILAGSTPVVDQSDGDGALWTVTLNAESGILYPKVQTGGGYDVLLLCKIDFMEISKPT